MKINPVQAIVASLVILTAGLVAETFKPQQLMASPSTVLDLEKALPRQFGDWRSIPNVGLVTPTGVPDADRHGSGIYSQEVARGYADRAGNVVMLLVAYGPVQDGRLKRLIFRKFVTMRQDSGCLQKPPPASLIRRGQRPWS